MGVTTGQILRYTLLPGIIPRVMALVTSGFSHIALYIAYVYRGVRLLPPGHPYLAPENVGRYGIRHVIFEASRNLVFKRQNADQIVIFFTLLAGIAILFLQFILLITGLLMPDAFAMGGYYHTFFGNDNPKYDLAFRILDLTFGFEDPYKIFNSCAIQGEQCQLAFEPGGGYKPVGPAYDMPTPFHTGLHALFHFYNLGLLVVAFMIGMYMVVTVVAETAQSGTPFGKRFNGFWAPMRLIIAIALLIPLAFGMNGAQLGTLMVAKWGSNLATNGWTKFMKDLNYIPIQQDPPTPEALVARPNAPLVNNLIEFINIAQTCMYAEMFLNQRTEIPKDDNEDDDPDTSAPDPTAGNSQKGNAMIRAYQVYGDKSTDLAGTTAGGHGGGTPGIDFNQALENAQNGDILIRFGAKDKEFYDDFGGNVKPICGELVIHTKDVTQPGALKMQEAYFNLVKDGLWNNQGLKTRAMNMAKRYMPGKNKDPDAEPIVDNEYVTETLNWFNKQWVEKDIDLARKEQIKVAWNDDFTVLGWAGAGIWYQKIAEYTGGLFASIYGTPTPRLYPEVMEHVKEQRRINDDFPAAAERFMPVLSKDKLMEFEVEDNDARLALLYYDVQKLWSVQYVETEGNTLPNLIMAIFGLTGLYNMHKNLDVHPLAQLVGIGRSLVERAVTNLGFAFGSGAVGGLSYILGENLVKSVALSAASFAGQVAMIGLAMGFILYYIVPFLPFIYFFFAFGGWLKGLFEAMVGLPLWAMAHIRIDGEGLPGPVAMNGYFLIFEIFVRPLLVIFGLVASVGIFSSQVQILNEIWQLVTSNVMGFDPSADMNAATEGTGAGVGTMVGSIEYLRGKLDEFFFMIMYAIIVYMLAMSSFKLIDQIPNHILRWMGSSVSAFSEQTGDPAGSLVNYAFMGSQMALQPLGSAINGIAARATPLTK